MPLSTHDPFMKKIIIFARDGHDIYEFEKEMDPGGYSDPALGLNTCI